VVQQVSCRSDKQFWSYELKQQLFVLRVDFFFYRKHFQNFLKKFLKD
jgi:hypothetical protein